MTHHRHYKHIHVPDSWEQYWSKYPNGYTVLEALINWVSQVNDMVDSQNEVSDQVVTLDRNFNALEKELRMSWNGYKEATTKTYEDFRDEVYTIINNWISTIEPTIQDETVKLMQGWLADGTLSDIINTDVFNMKVDTATYNAYTATTDARVGDLETVALENTELLTEVNNKLYISVTDFGAVGDGVTDDTQAIQNAINSCIGKSWQTIVFPPTEHNYLVSSLTIPNDTHTLFFQGIGRTGIEFTEQMGFHIKSEFIVFDKLLLRNKTALETGSTIDTRLFVDEREYNRLDFDLKVTNCNIQNWQRVVQTWGRGVELKNNGFNAITEFVVRLEVRPRAEISSGSSDIQTYDEGYRGYDVIGNRFHYCGGMIMNAAFDTEKVVQGITISDNKIEGTLSYFNGYANGFISKNNQHYHNGNTTRTLYEFQGGKNIDIEVDILNQKGKKMAQLFSINAPFENVSIRGRVSGSNKNLVGFYGGGKGAIVDLNVSDFNIGSYTPDLVTIAGSANVEGLLISGIVESPDKALSGNTFVPVRNQGTGNVTRFNFINLIVTGGFSHMTNIPSEA